MAETEVAPAAAPPAPVLDEASAAAGEESTGYDESLLIKVKGKVKKPTRPDDTERNMQVQKLQEEIDKASARIKEIKEIVESKQTTAKGGSAEQNEARQKLQQLRNEWQAVLVSFTTLTSSTSRCHMLYSHCRSLPFAAPKAAFASREQRQVR